MRRIETGLRDGPAEVASMPGVVDVRTLVAIGVVELDHDVDVEARPARPSGTVCGCARSGT